MIFHNLRPDCTVTASFKQSEASKSCTITIVGPTTYTWNGKTRYIHGWDGEVDVSIEGKYVGSTSGPGTGSMNCSLTYTGTEVKDGASVSVSIKRITMYYSSSYPTDTPDAGQFAIPVGSGSGTLDSNYRATISW